MCVSYATTPPPQSSSNQFQECGGVKSIPWGLGGDPETSFFTGAPVKFYC